jgi:hypothetical protein
MKGSYEESDKKICAAKVGPNECKHNREINSLFCSRHRHASDRIYLATHVITSEQLEYMMRRDGYYR